MSSNLFRVLAAAVCTVAVAVPVAAQAPASSEVSAPVSFTLPSTLPALDTTSTAREATAASRQVGTSSSGDWQFTVYPILVWVPLSIGIEVDLPFDLGAGGGSGGGGGVGSGNTGNIDLVDTRFDGAALAGFSATNGTWRFDFDGVYAAIGGDVNLPRVNLDANLIYLHATASRKIAGDFFVSGGVRRVATKFEARVLDRYDFETKPGIWDPLVGVGYHKVAPKLEFHATAEYGGFGVGADSDFGAAARLDWKPWSHFGFTAGYSFFQFKFTKELGRFDFTAKQRIAGPTVGLGIYF
jgi:hypothetical protein